MDMKKQIAEGQGFIAALDQSGGSTPKALRGYGVEDHEWSGDDEMFGKIHEMRSRIITARDESALEPVAPPVSSPDAWAL